jgi:hypothetical protein
MLRCYRDLLPLLHQHEINASIDERNRRRRASAEAIAAKDTKKISGAIEADEFLHAIGFRKSLFYGLCKSPSGHEGHEGHEGHVFQAVREKV